MISFKYGVILGAILLICIYFAYQNSKIREGIDEMPSDSAIKELHLENCIDNKWTNTPKTTPFPIEWQTAGAKYFADHLCDSRPGLGQCGFASFDPTITSWDNMSSGGIDEYRWQQINIPTANGNSTPDVTVACTGQDSPGSMNGISEFVGMCAAANNTNYGPSVSEKKALCISKIPIGGVGYVLKGHGYCNGNTPERKTSFADCRASCTENTECSGFSYRLTANTTTSNCRTWMSGCSPLTADGAEPGATVWVGYATTPKKDPPPPAPPSCSSTYPNCPNGRSKTGNTTCPDGGCTIDFCCSLPLPSTCSSYTEGCPKGMMAKDDAISCGNCFSGCVASDFNDIYKKTGDNWKSQNNKAVMWIGGHDSSRWFIGCLLANNVLGNAIFSLPVSELTDPANPASSTGGGWVWQQCKGGTNIKLTAIDGENIQVSNCPTSCPGTCPPQSCSQSECCVREDTCATYKKCTQLGYELDPDKTTTPCNKSICDDAQCCSKDTCVIASSAGIFTCEPQHHLDPAKQDYVCGDDCDSDTCCKLNNTCGVDPPTCPQNQYYSNDNSAVVCANAECISSDCCLDNPTCSNYHDCNTAKQHVGNPRQPCGGGTCDESCCVDNKKCGGLKKCNPKRHVDPNKQDTACNNNICTDKQCCSDNPKCGDDTDYSCPSSQYVSLAKKAYTCIGEKCTAGECCIPEPTCSTYQCSHPDTEHIPDNTIPCPNGICDDKTCCIPNIKCSTFKNCNPGHHLKEEDISCYSNICSDEQCCEANAKCGQFDDSGFTCEGNEYIKLPNHTCKEAKCTPQECCVADPTCGSYTCSVGHLQHIKDPSILCPDGNCTDELCCVDNDKCNSFTCPVGKHGIAEDERCTDNICTEDQCCVNNQRCATSWCDENYTLTNISTICKHKECTAKECCEPNQTCSSFSCEAGYTMRSSPAEIICEHLQCTTGDCCLKNQKCSTYNCRAGQTKKEDNTVCEGIKCTDEECCTNNPNCSTYNCESSYYTTRTLVPHAEGIICGELKCKESECCNSTPTNKLPKINVWPLS